MRVKEREMITQRQTNSKARNDKRRKGKQTQLAGWLYLSTVAFIIVFVSLVLHCHADLCVLLPDAHSSFQESHIRQHLLETVTEVLAEDKANARVHRRVCVGTI